MRGTNVQEGLRGVEQPLSLSGEDRRIASELTDPEQLMERILDPTQRRDVYPYYHRLRSLAPIHKTRVAGLPRDAYFLSRFRDVDRVARSPAAVNDPRTAEVWNYDGQGGDPFYQVMSRAMLFLEKEGHDRIRRLVYKAFTPAAVAPLAALTEQAAHELLDEAMNDRDFDFVEQFSYPLPLRAIMRMIGLPRESESQVVEWAWDFARAGDPMSATPEIVARGNRAAVGFREFFGQRFDECRRRPGDDLISALVHAEADGGHLSRDEAISTLVLLLQAGHDTTSDLLGNALIGLFRNPDQMAMLVDDPGLIPIATEELLRFDTSVQMSMRLAKEEIPLDGGTIPRDAIVVLGYGAANRDPQQYHEPDRLDLNRNPPHLSFSAGAYFCLGNALARTEIQSALAVLLHRLPTIRPAKDVFSQRRTTRMKGPLELRVTGEAR